MYRLKNFLNLCFCKHLNPEIFDYLENIEIIFGKYYEHMDIPLNNFYTDEFDTYAYRLLPFKYNDKTYIFDHTIEKVEYIKIYETNKDYSQYELIQLNSASL